MAAKMGILERSKELQKAMADNVSNATLLSHLQALQPWHADRDTLRSTKIGITVNALRGAKAKEEGKEARQVAELATRLVNKWKQDVLRKAPTGSVSGSSTPVNGVKKDSSATPTSDGVKTESTNKPFTGDKAKRSAKTDGVSTDVTDTLVRNKIIEGLYKFLAFMSDDAPDAIITCAKQIEIQMYDTQGPETNKEYAEKGKTLMRNLKENEPLRSNVLKGTISAKRLVNMTTDELKSDHMREVDRQFKKETMDEAMVPPETRSISTMFKCGKCGHNKTFHFQAQTRSADEPMTNFLECVQCGNEWKFSG